MLTAFLDIRKAYDSVNRKTLLEKLSKKGLKGKIIKNFKEFIGDRKARVRYKNEISELITFKRGVPQGSPLSPLLFNIYTSDIREIEKKHFPICR